MMSQEKFWSETEFTRFSPELAEHEKFAKLPRQDVISATACTQTKDVKERKLYVGQATHTKKTQLQQKHEASLRKSGTLILTAWRTGENRNDIERRTIKYFCQF